MESSRGGPSGSGRETPRSGRQSPNTGRRRWGAAVVKVESLLAVSTALDLFSIQKQRRALRDVDPWLIVERVRGLCQRRPPRPLPLVQDLVIHAGFLCGFIREQPLEAQIRLCQVVQFEDVGRGKLVCRQGEPGDRFYMIIHGCVSIQSLTAKRQVRNLGNLGRGDYFGDIALINGQARQATCITRSDTCLLTVGKDDFLELYKNRFSVRCVQAIKFLRKQVRPFLTVTEPSLRLFAHYLCLLCFNPGTTWTVDEEGTIYFIRAGEAELLIPLPREDPRFKIEGPYISVTRFKEGDYFGESSVFPEDRCGWLVRAVTPMQLFSVRGKDFLKHADASVISTIRAESSFRVGYYAGRHSQPTPQLAERPSTSQLRLADAQRRSRRSTQPTDGRKDVDRTQRNVDGNQRAFEGTTTQSDGAQQAFERTPKTTDGVPGVTKGTHAVSSGRKDERSRPPLSPGKGGAQEKGSAEGLTERSPHFATSPKGVLNSPSEREKGLRGLDNGLSLEETRGLRKQLVTGSGEIRAGEANHALSGTPKSGSAAAVTKRLKGSGVVPSAESSLQRSEGGGEQNAAWRARDEAQSEAIPTAGRDQDARAERSGSGALASTSGEGATVRPKARLRGDERAGAGTTMSPAKSPLGLGTRAETRTPSERSTFEKGDGILSTIVGTEEPGNVMLDVGEREIDQRSSEAAHGRRWTCPQAAPLSGTGSGTGTLLRTNSDHFSRAAETEIGLHWDASNVNDVSSTRAGRDDAKSDVEHEAGEAASGDDVTGASRGASPDGGPRSGGRRSRRRARWRVRARSALSTVEVSLETARRLREEESPRDSQFPRHVPGIGTSRVGRRWENEDGEKPSIAAADAEVARRSAPKGRLRERGKQRDDGVQKRPESGALPSAESGSLELTRAAKASRLAQVYGPRKPARRQSNSSATAVRTEESAVLMGARAQSVSVPGRQGSGGSPGALSSKVRKRLQSLPMLHHPPGSPEHAREALEALEKFAAPSSGETPTLPPVDLLELPPVDLTDLPTPSEIVRMELGPEENRSLSLVPLPLDELTLPWQAYTIPVASSKRWDGIQSELKRKEKAKAARLRRRTGLTELQLKQSELQALAYLRSHNVDLLGGRDLH